MRSPKNPARKKWNSTFRVIQSLHRFRHPPELDSITRIETPKNKAHRQDPALDLLFVINGFMYSSWFQGCPR
ncbi:hypothetical protein QR680_002316 [Steinernema hermaphroditum]|uniref:Uncharacterized protein n=1 Tax=Steinernema hermaphroditum TaxID=289476 RepID=A0AA39LHW6_9BILA|nr:hypothetical protein QR680_002316 [Steinernema hermaphroditum]